MVSDQTIVVTGGAGFIGSAVIRHLITHTSCRVVNVDKLTYAGNLDSLREVSDHPRYTFAHLDICDAAGLTALLAEYRPTSILHLAAESHVDRSIDAPEAFIQTNVVGTYTLLETARRYWTSLAPEPQRDFRFLHVSTDEVYGALGQEGYFTEETSYQPNSPYSAAKAGSDHLARAWHHTYGLPVLVTNCSNNYGPYQFPEKLIPIVIAKAMAGEAIPVYGRGENVRDWLYVEDHVRALLQVLSQGVVGETYIIGGRSEKNNLEVVETLCTLLDELRPRETPYRDQITFVEDRPGHDFRYAIDPSKIENQLGWVPQETFETGLRKTVAWYLAHQPWVKRVVSGAYRLERLGLSQASTVLPA